MKPTDKLLSRLNNAEVSRRDFLKKASALGIAGALPGALLSTNAVAAKPKRGGHLRIALAGGSTGDSLDPTRLTSPHINFLYYTTHAQLTEVLPNGELSPYLAESYEYGKDASEWIFKLRKGAEFHNGKTITADDVIASLDRHRGEDSASQMKSFMQEIISLKKDGDSTVIIKLQNPNVDFPTILSAPTLGILPSTNGKVEDFTVGSGAYMLEKFEPGQRSLVKRNPNFFFPDRGYVDSAEILTIADSTARQNALVTGAVDVIGDVPAATADLLARNAKIKVLDVTGMMHDTFPMLTNQAPLDNNHVRMALKLSIDREEVLEKILSGHGMVGNDHPISPVNRFFNTELEQRVYDPEKAKWHLKQAGLSKLKIKLSVSDSVYAGAVDTAVLYSEQAKKSGIEITPNRVPADGYWKDVWLKHPWCVSNWSGRPTEDWMFTQAYAATSNWNETLWKNDRFNELLVAARAELEDSKRRDMYYEMQRLVRDDGGSVVHLFANHITAYNENVGVPSKVAGNWEFDGFKMVERWWLNS